MKKYILLALIFIVFSICGGEDSSQTNNKENQTTQNFQNEDINISENDVSKEQEPNPPQQQELPKEQKSNQIQQPEQPQQQEPPQGQQPNEEAGKKIENVTYVIFESNMAPFRTEELINLVIPIPVEVKIYDQNGYWTGRTRIEVVPIKFSFSWPKLRDKGQPDISQHVIIDGKEMWRTIFFMCPKKINTTRF